MEDRLWAMKKMERGLGMCYFEGILNWILFLKPGWPHPGLVWGMKRDAGVPTPGMEPE